MIKKEIKKKNLICIDTNQNKLRKTGKHFSRYLKILVTICLLAYNYAYAYDTEKIVRIILEENQILKNSQTLVQMTKKSDKEVGLIADTGIIQKDDIEAHDETRQYYYAKLGLKMTLPLLSKKDQQEVIKRESEYSEKEQKITDQAYSQLAELLNYDIKISSRTQEIKFLLDKIKWANKRVESGIEEAKFLWELVESHIDACQKLEILKNERKFLIQKIARMGGDKCNEILKLLGEKGEKSEQKKKSEQ